jgi:hypothetical protein
MYRFLVIWHAFISLSAAAMIFGGPEESSPHVVYAAAVVFVAATVGLIVSSVLAVRYRGQVVRHRGAKKSEAVLYPNTVRRTGPARVREQIED